MSEINPLDVAVGDDPELDSPRPMREGLPSDYRMRADAHYVDHVIARRQERAAAEVSFRGSRSADREVAREPKRDAADPRGERLRAELADGLATISSAAAMIAGEPSGLARKVGVDLIRAEAWRAEWLLRAQAILAGAHRVRRQLADPAVILDRVAQGLASECRLSGATIEVRPASPGVQVAVDQDALAAGIAGAVVWALGHGPADVTSIVLAVEASDEHRVAVEIRHAHGGVAAESWSAPSRQSDAWAATLGASTAKAVAELHGGSATFLAGEDGGSTVRFTFG